MISLLQNIESIAWSTWLNSIISVFFLAGGIVFFTRKMIHSQSTKFNLWVNVIADAAKKPLIFLFILCVFYIGLYTMMFLLPESYKKIDLILFNVVPVFVKWSSVLLALWFIWRLSSAIQNALKNTHIFDPHSKTHIIIPIINNITHALIILFAVNIIISQLIFSPAYTKIVDKILRLMVIGTCGAIFYQIVNGIEKIILSQFEMNNSMNFSARKVQTQVLVLKRVILIIGFLVAIASALFIFDSVKKLGAGLLTTAGIISAVGAFASQQSLSRLFSGLQLAFTQPIRMGDTVVVDNQTGVVEEITISYVVVKLWDLTRLIIPTDNIMSRGFQNLTRSSTQLIGSIYIYIDYLLPIDKLREKFVELTAQSSLWDKNICTLQVTELKEQNIQVRGLVSASNGANLWALRCELREKLLAYIIEHFPNYLPKVRQITVDK